MGNEIKDLGKMTMFGVDEETYDGLLKVAKSQGKSVVDVASEALKTHINHNSNLKESNHERKVLCEG